MALDHVRVGHEWPPRRVQRQRTRGWRLLEGTTYVGRPGRWGNPFPAGDPSPFSPQEAVRMYRELVEHGETWWTDLVGTRYEFRQRFTRGCAYARRGGLVVPTVAEVRQELAGRDLACWCPLDAPCHADVLLALANPTEAAR